MTINLPKISLGHCSLGVSLIESAVSESRGRSRTGGINSKFTQIVVGEPNTDGFALGPYGTRAYEGTLGDKTSPEFETTPIVPTICGAIREPSSRCV